MNGPSKSYNNPAHPLGKKGSLWQSKWTKAEILAKMRSVDWSNYYNQKPTREEKPIINWAKAISQQVPFLKKKIRNKPIKYRFTRYI